LSKFFEILKKLKNLKNDIKKMISIIIPTYNRAKLIKESIKSVLNQTYQNFELLIMDDGSSDNNQKIIKYLNF